MSDNLPAVHAGGTVDLNRIGVDTQLAIQSNGRQYLVTPREILEWVAPGAPLSEAKKHLVICQTLGLNPLLGEIDLLPFAGKYQTVVRKAGYVKCARNDASYDGHESGITVQKFEKDAKGKITRFGPMIDVPGHIQPDNQHMTVGGWCKAYRKGISRPFYKRVSLTEYAKNSGTWQTIPNTMIEKVAIAHAYREAYDMLAGTYDDSEMDRLRMESEMSRQRAEDESPGLPPSVQARVILGPVAQDAPKLPEPSTTQREWTPGTATLANDPRPPITTAQEDDINRLVLAAKLSEADYAKMLHKRDVSSLGELDTFQASEIIRNLERVLDARGFAAELGGETGPVIPDTAPEPVAAPVGGGHTDPEVIDAVIS